MTFEFLVNFCLGEIFTFAETVLIGNYGHGNCGHLILNLAGEFKIYYTGNVEGSANSAAGLVILLLF